MQQAELLRAQFPDFDFREVRVVDDGWDSLVLEVDDEWIFRFPRRREVELWVEREIALLPELAQTLPVAVPRFELVARDGILCVGYRKLPGSPAYEGVGEQTGDDIGRLLRALHGFPVERARELGIPIFDPGAWRVRFEALCDDFRRRVFPLIGASERERAESVFAASGDLAFEPVLIHGDLGPDHVLCRGERVVGVIDWSDARVGDAALDLAWCLNGAPAPVADAVARVYGVDAGARERSRFYHRLAPWYQVVYGLETGNDRFLASGLDRVRARLPELST